MRKIKVSNRTQPAIPEHASSARERTAGHWAMSMLVAVLERRDRLIGHRLRDAGFCSTRDPMQRPRPLMSATKLPRKSPTDPTRALGPPVLRQAVSSGLGTSAVPRRAGVGTGAAGR